jgi:hypothetical protein
MRYATLATAAVATLALAGAAKAAPLRGDYVEARSLSVYAGACHYSAEEVTAGKQATLAWRFTGGDSNGVSLKGVAVVAVVVGDSNLAHPNVPRRSILYVSNTATAAERNAAARVLSSRYSAVLGTVTAVRAAPVTFECAGRRYRVAVPGAVLLVADLYPCKQCTMDMQVWYRPFVTLTDTEVADTLANRFADRSSGLGATWAIGEANSSFAGSFVM